MTYADEREEDWLDCERAIEDRRWLDERKWAALEMMRDIQEYARARFADYAAGGGADDTPEQMVASIHDVLIDAIERRVGKALAK